MSTRLDVDNDIGRIRSGREISRARKTTSIRNEEHRALLKQKLSVGELTPWQFLQSSSHTVGCMPTIHHSQLSDSEDDSGEQNTNTPEHLCVVCLSPRTTTWISCHVGTRFERRMQSTSDRTRVTMSYMPV